MERDEFTPCIRAGHPLIIALHLNILSLSHACGVRTGC
jgi:hypothetical protein